MRNYNSKWRQKYIRQLFAAAIDLAAHEALPPRPPVMRIMGRRLWQLAFLVELGALRIFNRRALALLSLLLMLALGGCTRPPSQTTTTIITTNWLVTQFGEHQSPDGRWRVSVPEANHPFKLGRGEYLDHVKAPMSNGTVATWTGALTNTYSTEGWKAQPGWFIFVEGASRAWCYDGSNYLWLLQVDATGSSGSYGPRSFPCPVPPQVYARLSDSAQKAVIRPGQ